MRLLARWSILGSHMTKRGAFILIGIVVVVLTATIVFVSLHHYARQQAQRAPGITLADSTTFATYAGSAACRDCHPVAYDK